MRKTLTARQQTILETSVDRIANNALQEVKEHVLVKPAKRLTNEERVALVKMYTKLPMKSKDIDDLGYLIIRLFDLSSFEWEAKINTSLKERADAVVFFTQNKYKAMLGLVSPDKMEEWIEDYRQELKENLNIIFDNTAVFRF